jgi:hypothetical protein
VTARGDPGPIKKIPEPLVILAAGLAGLVLRHG